MTLSRHGPYRKDDAAPAPPTYHDRDGDLRLLVGPLEEVHLVCPRTLARVSPVWKAMLYGPMQESRPESGDWVVKLAEDDVAALSLLLATAHSAWDALPKQLSPEQLYNVCKLTDKYDVLKLLRPWMSDWLDKIMTMTTLVMALVERPVQLVWMGWYLGAHRLFIETFFQLMTRCDVDDNGLLSRETVTGAPSSDADIQELPDEVLDAMTAVRARLVLNIIGRLTGAWDKLINPEGCLRIQYCDSCRAVGPEVKNAESIVLAALLRGLVQAELHPLPDAKQVKTSLLQLLAKIQQLGKLLYHDPPHHARCVLVKLELQGMKDSIFSFWDSESETTVRDLKSQLEHRAGEMRRANLIVSQRIQDEEGYDPSAKQEIGFRQYLESSSLFRASLPSNKRRRQLDRLTI